jgi:uncharacterized protein (DUF1697 family)
VPATHAALLRGINVGKAKRVGMADLRAIIEGLGCEDVRTLLNSGNVVFRAPRAGAARLATDIQAALEARLGITSRVIVLTVREVDALVSDQPFGRRVTDPARCMVLVPATASGLTKLTPIASADWEREAVAIGTRAAYVWCPDGLLESRAFAELAKRLGDEVTTRNWATVLKLQAAIR